MKILDLSKLSERVAKGIISSLPKGVFYVIRAESIAEVELMKVAGNKTGLIIATVEEREALIEAVKFVEEAREQERG